MMSVNFKFDELYKYKVGGVTVVSNLREER